MTNEREPQQPKPDASDTERSVAEQAKQPPADSPGKDGKPDEGIRPDQLTSENDGGAEG